MSVALPVWHTMAQREKEEELIFRGEQYARAIALFQRRFPGAVPPTLQVLLDAHLLRKKYKDPMTNDDFQLIGPNDNVALQAESSSDRSTVERMTTPRSVMEAKSRAHVTV